MSALCLDGYSFGPFLCNKFRIAFCGVINEINIETASCKNTGDSNFVSSALKLPRISKSINNFSWRFQSVFKLIDIIG